MQGKDAWNPERINTEYHATRVNPLNQYLKKYEDLSDYDSENEPEIDLEQSQAELEMMNKISLIPNCQEIKPGEEGYNIGSTGRDFGS
jgi:hypothetical protein